MNYKFMTKENIILKMKGRKKKGFTLIELIAVIAIIGILAVVFLPKVNGYINEAKKVKVVDQCRKIVMAVESYDMANGTPLAQTTSVGSAKALSGVSKYLDGVALDKVPNDTTIARCYAIVNGADFSFTADTDVLSTAANVVP